MAVTIYTDGSQVGKRRYNQGGPGGLAYIIIKDNHVVEHAIGFYHTNNHRMEFLAVIMALEKLSRRESVKVYTDSMYVVKAMTCWRFRHKRKRKINRGYALIKNLDLIFRLRKLMLFHQVKFYWIKGHSGNKYNERCDQLAKIAAYHPTDHDAIFHLTH